VFFFLEEFSQWKNCVVTCEGSTFDIRRYGSRAYITRQHDGQDIMRCTLVDGKLTGGAFLYKGGVLSHILKYKHHNLHGEQVSLDKSYKITAKEGDLIGDVRSNENGTVDILFANEMILALLKWR